MLAVQSIASALSIYVPVVSAFGASATSSGAGWLVTPLAQTADGRWVPGIGDPTFLGWTTVVAYFLAAYACYRARRGAALFGVQARRPVFLWTALTWLLVLLGINKQLDLQSLLTVVGRDLAHAQGWYQDREVVQRWFIRAIAGVGMAAGIAVAAYLWGHLRRLWLAVLGASFLMVFVLVRASSFHDVDILLSSRVGNMKVNWLLELGGIACIGWDARRFVARVRQARARARTAANMRSPFEVQVSVRPVQGSPPPRDASR